MPRRDTVGALVVFALVSFLYFGLPIAAHPGRYEVGSGTDPNLFVWMFAWWPHAISHGENPFHSYAIWVPDGYDLAWTTSVPGLAVIFAPLTLAAGPVVAYNVASILMPALAAWTAYLLCRHVTRRTWPSLAGGYLFGFSSYMLGQQLGHVHLTSIFLVPLVALVTLRYVDGSLGARRLAVGLGVLLGVQAWFAAEVLLTTVLALLSGLALAYLVAPERRRRLRSALWPLAAGGALAFVLASPVLVAMFAELGQRPTNLPWRYPTDLLDLVVPTRTALVSWGTGGVSSHYLAGPAETGGYFGVPVLVIVALFLRRSWRAAPGQFLFLAALLPMVAALGTALYIDGRRIVALPWALASHVLLLHSLLPGRLAVFATLAVSVMVASWAATSSHRLLAIVLTAVAVVSLLPRLGAGYWKNAPVRPALFVHYKQCLVQGESVLALPYNGRGDSNLWQAESGFYFNLAEGYVSISTPPSYNDPAEEALWSDDRTVTGSSPDEVVRFARSKGVTVIVVPRVGDHGWTRYFERVLPPHRVGGVTAFLLQPGPETSAACRAAAGP